MAQYKWKVSRYGSEIKRVEFVKETAKFVWVEQWQFNPDAPSKFRQESKADYFDTWELAHAHLLERAEGRLELARMELQRAQGSYGNVKGMKKPEDA